MNINHVTLLVSDKEKAKNFFVDKLGFEPHRIGDHLWIRVGDQFIHLTESSGPPMSGTFYHVAITVDNLKPFLERIIDRGVDVFDVGQDGKPSRVNQDLDDPNRTFFVRDPDGNLIEFISADNAFFKG